MSWDANSYIKKLKVSPSGERVTRSEKYLLLYLSIHYNDEIGGAWPSHEMLAGEALYHVRQVIRILESCERKEIIRTWEKAVKVIYAGQVRLRNFYTFPALEGAYSDDNPPEITVKFNGKSYSDILPREGQTYSDISDRPIVTKARAHNKEVNTNGNASACASEADEPEVVDVLAACQRARYRPATHDLIAQHWKHYVHLTALCYKARNKRARAILTDKHKKTVVEFIVEMAAAEADLDLIPRFAEAWKASWMSRGGKEPPTVNQVREYWTQLTAEDEDAPQAPISAQDEQSRLEGLRKGEDWSR